MKLSYDQIVWLRAIEDNSYRNMCLTDRIGDKARRALKRRSLVKFDRKAGWRITTKGCRVLREI